MTKNPSKTKQKKILQDIKNIEANRLQAISKWSAKDYQQVIQDLLKGVKCVQRDLSMRRLRVGKGNVFLTNGKPCCIWGHVLERAGYAGKFWPFLGPTFGSRWGNRWWDAGQAYTWLTGLLPHHDLDCAFTDLQIACDCKESGLDIFSTLKEVEFQLQHVLVPKNLNQR